MPPQNLKALAKYLQVLTSMSSFAGNIQNQRILEKETNNAISLAQGLLGKLW